MSKEPYILKMRPYFRKKIWGGRRLETTFGKELPDDSDYGEAWEVSDLEEGQSFVVNGPLEGSSLSEVVETWGAALLGNDGDAFPLLVKILDAQRDLSVQVHPGEADLVNSDLEGESKDECWLILDAEPEGAILHGFDDGVSREAFEEAVEEERVENLLRRVNVEAGDVIRVEPGTIHAICEGVALLEIQQPSDTTYRVYDYGRLGDDGQPRDLHLEQALQVADFGAHAPAVLEEQEARISTDEVRLQTLVQTQNYAIEKLAVDGAKRLSFSASTPNVVFTLDGTVQLNDSVELAAGETAVIPAEVTSADIKTDDSADLVVAGAEYAYPVENIE